MNTVRLTDTGQIPEGIDGGLIVDINIDLNYFFWPEWALLESNGRSAGSGVYLGGGIVLTAAHVVLEDDASPKSSFSLPSEFLLTFGSNVVGEDSVLEAVASRPSNVFAIDSYRSEDIESGGVHIFGEDTAILKTGETISIGGGVPSLIVFQNPNDAAGQISAIGYPGQPISNGETPFVSSTELVAGSYGMNGKDQDLWLTDIQTVEGSSGSGLWLEYSVLGDTNNYISGVLSIGGSPDENGIYQMVGVEPIGDVYWKLAATLDREYEGSQFGQHLIVADLNAGGELSGTFFNERIVGNDFRNTLSGWEGSDELHGFDGNDLLFGGSDDDTIFGGEGVDTLFGGTGNDLLFGNQNNDTFYGGEGQDTLNGGSGTDTAVFELNWTEYAPSSSVGGISLSQLGLGGETDRLVDIERLQFADRTFQSVQEYNDAYFANSNPTPYPPPPPVTPPAGQQPVEYEPPTYTPPPAGDAPFSYLVPSGDEDGRIFVVGAQRTTLEAGKSIPVSELFPRSGWNDDGETIGYFAVSDRTDGGGYLTLNGKRVPDFPYYEMPISLLPFWEFVAGEPGLDDEIGFTIIQEDGDYSPKLASDQAGRIESVMPDLAELYIDDVEVNGQRLDFGETVTRSFEAGDRLTVEYDVENRGDVDAGRTTTALFFYDGDDFERVDTEETDRTIEADDDDRNEEMTFRVPGSLNDGVYSAFIVPDVFNDEPEAIEGGDRIFAFKFTVQEDVPSSPSLGNLVSENFTASASAVTGGNSLSFQWRVENEGDASVGGFSSGLYISVDPNVTRSDLLIAEAETVGGLDDGASRTLTAENVVIPDTLSAGTYFVAAIADHKTEVIESRRIDNVSQPVTIQVDVVDEVIDPPQDDSDEPIDDGDGNPVPPQDTSFLELQPTALKGKDVSVTSVFWQDTGGGRDFELLRTGGWGDWYHSLLQFDIPSLGGDLVSAELQLYSPKITDTRFSKDQVELYRVIGDWDESLGYYDADRPSVEYVGTYPAPEDEDGWYYLDVTDLVASWENGDFPNYGFELRTPNNNARLNDFLSSDYPDPELRPKLVLEFEGDNPLTLHNDYYQTTEDQPLEGHVILGGEEGQGADRSNFAGANVVALRDSSGNELQLGVENELPAGGTIKLVDEGTLNFDPAGAFDYLEYGQTAVLNFEYEVQNTVPSEPEFGYAGVAEIEIVVQGISTADDPVDDSPPPTTLPTYSITAETSAVTEGDTGQQEVRFTISRDIAAVAATVTVSQTGTVDGDDFSGAPLPFDLTVGQFEVSFAVLVNGDTDVEADEVIEFAVVSISEPANIATSSASTAIQNDDTAEVVDDLPDDNGLPVVIVEVIPGSDGDDKLVGSDDSEVLIDGLGNDKVFGGAGNDSILISGGGLDRVVGGEDGDYFILDPLLTQNGFKDVVKILDYELEDTINLNGAEIAEVREINKRVQITLAGEDDLLEVKGVNRLADITFTGEPISDEDSAPVPPINVVMDEPGNDKVRGGSEDDEFVFVGGDKTRVLSGEGNDVFRLDGPFVSNGSVDEIKLLDFDPAFDALVLGGTQINEVVELNKRLKLFVGEDDDLIELVGVNDFDDVTIFSF